MVSRTAWAWVASPVTGERSRAERIMAADLGTRPSLVQEFPGVGAVEGAEAELRPVQALRQARVDAHAIEGAVEALPVGGDPTGLAAVQGEHAVAPDIGLSRARRGLGHLGRRIVGPASGDPAADRAIALGHRVRSPGKREASGSAVAGGLDHPGPPYPT